MATSEQVEQMERMLAEATRSVNPDNTAPTYATIGLALAVLTVSEQLGRVADLLDEFVVRSRPS